MKTERIKYFIWVVLFLFALTGCAGNNLETVKTSGRNMDEVAVSVTRTLAALLSANQLEATSTPAPSLQRSNTPALSIQPTNTAQPTQTSTPILSATVAEAATATPIPASPITSNISSSKPQPNTAVIAECIDKAAFVADVTVPDNTLLNKNADFTKTWRIKNVGTCTWGDGYQLVFARGQILGGPPSLPLPKADPGVQIDISVNLKTPADGGTYAGDWEFQNPAGTRFGVNSHGEDFIYLIIKVDWGPGVGPTPAPPPVTCSYQRNPDDEMQLFQWINQERTSNGLAALTMQPQLNAAALAHSADMACNNFLDHSGSDKSTYSQRIQTQGYKAANDNENIYAGGNAQDAFDWWKGSPIHYANMMNSQITQIGIGYVVYASSKFGAYYTLDFGRPR